MHDPENPIENPQLFTNRQTQPLEPSSVARGLESEISKANIKLGNQAKETDGKKDTQIGFIDGLNDVLGQVAIADRKKTPLQMNPEVSYFIQTYSAALGDISDEIYARTSESQVEGKLKIEARTDHAIINQRFSQALYSAARAPEGDIQRRNARIFYKTMSQLRETGLGNAAIRELDAARAQSAAMLVFENAGYRVLVPDYNDEDEVRNMDVLAMADLVAISPEGQVFFVDVKGRHFDDRGRKQEVVESRKKIIDDRDQNASLRRQASKDIMRDLSKRKELMELGYSISAFTEPNRIEITIPTDDSCLSPLGEVLNPEVALDIIRSVRR